LYEVDEQKITGSYPVFKPVSLSDFQIGADITERIAARAAIYFGAAVQS